MFEVRDGFGLTALDGEEETDFVANIGGVGLQYGRALKRRECASGVPFGLQPLPFHARLRGFFYPSLFDDQPFTVDAIARMPQFQARPVSTQGTAASLLALGAAGALALLAGGLATRRLRI